MKKIIKKRSMLYLNYSVKKYKMIVYCFSLMIQFFTSYSNSVVPLYLNGRIFSHIDKASFQVKILNPFDN